MLNPLGPKFRYARHLYLESTSFLGCQRQQYLQCEPTHRPFFIALSITGISGPPASQLSCLEIDNRENFLCYAWNHTCSVRKSLNLFPYLIGSNKSMAETRRPCVWGLPGVFVIFHRLSYLQLSVFFAIKPLNRCNTVRKYEKSLSRMLEGTLFLVSKMFLDQECSSCSSKLLLQKPAA